MSTIHIQLNQFEGPLDLLLHLIGRAKIDIRDIFVSEVTDQYIRIVREAGELDMDEASSFVALAATLLEIKSRALLPSEEMEDEYFTPPLPPELIQKLLSELGEPFRIGGCVVPGGNQCGSGREVVQDRDSFPASRDHLFILIQDASIRSQRITKGCYCAAVST